MSTRCTKNAEISASTKLTTWNVFPRPGSSPRMPPPCTCALNSHATPSCWCRCMRWWGDARTSARGAPGWALPRSSRARTVCPLQTRWTSEANLCALCRLQHRQISGRWCSTESTDRIVAAERAIEKVDRCDPALLTERGEGWLHACDAP